MASTLLPEVVVVVAMLAADDAPPVVCAVCVVRMLAADSEGDGEPNGGVGCGWRRGVGVVGRACASACAVVVPGAGVVEMAGGGANTVGGGLTGKLGSVVGLSVVLELLMIGVVVGSFCFDGVVGLRVGVAVPLALPLPLPVPFPAPTDGLVVKGWRW
jgi:hypothetical protein